MPQADSTPSPGLHTYKLIAEIGRGGMANVYLAVMRGQGGFNKLVVVKRTRVDILLDGDIQGMFLDEARLAARMNHPNVVQTYECGKDDDSYFITMEYLDGQPYSRVLSRFRGTLPLTLHARVVADALTGLHHAHELRDFDGTPLDVVHRDATPHNVFVTYDGSIKVVDFGIAKALDSAAHTVTGVVKGKVSFMSPEQVRGEPLDRRTDVFAAGVMLWEAIAGRRMWEMPELSIVHELMNDHVPSIRAHAPEAPAHLLAIVDRAVAPRRQDRYPTAIDLARDLETWLATTGERATARDVGERIAPAFAAERARVREVIESELRDLRWTGVLARVSVPTGDEPSLVMEPEEGLPRSRAAAPVADIASVSTSPARARIESVTSGPLTPGGLPSSPPLQAQTGSFVPTESGAAMPARRSGALRDERNGNRSLVWPSIAAAGACLAVVALGVRVFAWPKPESAPVPASATALPSGSAPAHASAEREPPAPESVTLTVKGDPPDARVFLDGMLLSVGPFEGRVMRASKAHTLRIEAQDYTPKEQSVTFGADLLVTFDLARAEAVTPPVGAKATPGKGADPVKSQGKSQKHDIDSDSPYKR